MYKIFGIAEFGFLVMGHEFDHYPKGMVRSVKNWDWFLDEAAKDSDDDDDFVAKRTNMKGKRKKAKDNEDDDWTVESEEDKDVANKRKVKRSGYSTRSKDQNRGTKNAKGSKSSERKEATGVDEAIEDEDDEETLGGFIVDDEEEDREGENSEEEDEEEFDEEEDDDDEMEE